MRWDSAQVVRQALARSKALGAKSDTSFPDIPDHPEEYVVTVLGLFPAKPAPTAEATFEKQSSSDDTQSQAAVTEKLLEDFMSNSTLATHAEAVRPRNAQVDAATGAVRLYFPRSLNLDTKVKEAYFSTRYGSLSVKKRFRLNDLTYKGKLEL